MKIVKLLSLAAGMAVFPAMAETAGNAQAPAAVDASASVQVKTGVLVIAADGRRIGRVDRVIEIGDAPVSVSVIYNGRIVRIPVDTLSNSDRGLVSTLSSQEIKKL